MRHYYRTLGLVAIAVSLLLVCLLTGCQQSKSPKNCEQRTWIDQSGSTWAGGCVDTPVRNK
ncbi:MAG: hypothetical protein ABFD89_03670 [Bryobacteraceae bacterium]